MNGWRQVVGDCVVEHRLTTYNDDDGNHVWQHGANPEHALTIPRISISENEPGHYLNELADWINRIHARASNGSMAERSRPRERKSESAERPPETPKEGR